MQGALPTITFDAPPNGATVEVVGESKYQGSLQVLAGGYDANGPRVRDHKAVLLPEPNNPYDANAVRVVVVAASGVWGTVGYLARGDAVAYRPVIDRLAGLGWMTGCLASLKGGQVRDDAGARNYVGVTLHLGSVAACNAEIDADVPPPAWERAP